MMVVDDEWPVIRSDHGWKAALISVWCSILLSSGCLLVARNPLCAAASFGLGKDGRDKAFIAPGGTIELAN